MFSNTSFGDVMRERRKRIASPAAPQRTPFAQSASEAPYKTLGASTGKGFSIGANPMLDAIQQRKQRMSSSSVGGALGGYK